MKTTIRTLLLLSTVSLVACAGQNHHSMNGGKGHDEARDGKKCHVSQEFMKVQNDIADISKQVKEIEKKETNPALKKSLRAVDSDVSGLTKDVNQLQKKMCKKHCDHDKKDAAKKQDKAAPAKTAVKTTTTTTTKKVIK